MLQLVYRFNCPALNQECGIVCWGMMCAGGGEQSHGCVGLWRSRGLGLTLADGAQGRVHQRHDPQAIAEIRAKILVATGLADISRGAIAGVPWLRT